MFLPTLWPGARLFRPRGFGDLTGRAQAGEGVGGQLPGRAGQVVDPQHRVPGHRPPRVFGRPVFMLKPPLLEPHPYGRGSKLKS